MDETRCRLDGNAVAGLLEEAFGHEVTCIHGRCAHCGGVAELGAQHLYRYPDSPGAVLRCRSCESVLMVIVRGGNCFRVGLPGVAWFDFGATVSAAGGAPATP